MPRSWSSLGGSNVPSNVSLYASVGPELTHYDVDVEGAALTRLDTVGLPANVQYIWPHASRRFLYAATRQRVRHGRCRQYASRDRVANRSGQWRPGAARRADSIADAADPHGHRHSLAIPPGRVQQSQCYPRLSNQC